MKSIALFVIGHSPAIIAETVVAQYVQGETIDSIRIVTTCTGAALLRHQLFAEKKWERCCQVWPEMRTINFSPEAIVFSETLDDIRSEQESRAMAALILSETKRAIDDSDRVLASLAGGRKTMGYYLGFAMSLFAREGDSLGHVLVPAEWEQDRTLSFPTPLQAQHIDLVDIPFIRLRNHLKPSLANADVSTLVTSAQTAIDMAALQPLTLHIRRRMIRYMGKEIILSEREFSLFQFFSQQKVNGCKEKTRTLCGDCCSCFLSVVDMDSKRDELFSVRVQFGGVDDGNYMRFVDAWSMQRAASINLPEPLRRIASAIERVFGADPRSRALLIRNVGRRNHAAYGLMADKTQIRIERE